jgi:hypothetical protein
MVSHLMPLGVADVRNVTMALSARPPFARSRWIVGAWTDVVMVILPVIAGYLCLYAHLALGISSFLIWWFWNLTLNGPHFYATISRTYLDREEWRQRAPLLLGSLGWIFVGPVALYASLVTHSPLPFLGFWAFQVVWAYFHVTRQHYGFLTLYQRLNGEPAGRANAFDYWTFHLLMFGPVLAWFVQFPELRRTLGWETALSPGEGPIVTLTCAGVAFIVLLCVVRVFREARSGAVNVPKVLLLVAYIPLHLLLLLRPLTAGGYDILLLNAVITSPHNVQYMAIVWFHNSNRYRSGGARAQYGWAVPASATPWRFIAIAAVYSVIFFYLGWVFEGQPVPLLPMRLAWPHQPLGTSYRMADLISAIWVGFVFHHQYLDQRIWKLSSDRQLAEDLRLAPAA